MSAVIGCIADDFTGATDLAGVLAKAGLRTVQMIGVPAVSCMAGLGCENCIPPLTACYVRKIGRLLLLPCFRPGGPRAAEAVQSRACRHCAVLLANHDGPVVAGTSLDGP